LGPLAQPFTAGSERLLPSFFRPFRAFHPTGGNALKGVRNDVLVEAIMVPAVNGWARNARRASEPSGMTGTEYNSVPTPERDIINGTLSPFTRLKFRVIQFAGFLGSGGAT
jgi:hypothetical protein